MSYRIIIGGLFVMGGLVILFRHEQIIKAWNDANHYNMWTGRFTRGGKVFFWLLGSLLAIYGLVIVFGMLR